MLLAAAVMALDNRCICIEDDGIRQRNMASYLKKIGHFILE